MRGEKLARQWQLIRAIEASPNGLTVAEIPAPNEAQGSGQNREPFKSLFQMLGWAFLLWGAEANRLFQTLFKERF